MRHYWCPFLCFSSKWPQNRKIVSNKTKWVQSSACHGNHNHIAFELGWSIYYSSISVHASLGNVYKFEVLIIDSSITLIQQVTTAMRHRNCKAHGIATMEVRRENDPRTVQKGQENIPCHPRDTHSWNGIAATRCGNTRPVQVPRGGREEVAWERGVRVRVLLRVGTGVLSFWKGIHRKETNTYPHFPWISNVITSTAPVHPTRGHPCGVTPTPPF